jgi:hypothetical protein
VKISTALIMATISLLSLPATAAYGTPFEGWGFVQDDWQLVCDNTLTCRAAGYADESLWDTPASILLTALPREALPTAKIQFLPEVSLQSNNHVELWLNGKNYGNLQPDADGYLYDLTTQQTKKIINHAHLNTKIEIKVGNDSWIISDKGMSAVLLKLDEVQGRVGTALALVSKNNPNRQSPKKAKAKPVIKKAYAYLEKDKKQLDAKKLTYFQAKINNWVDIGSEQFVGSENVMGDCELINPKSEASKSLFAYANPSWNFIPIDANHTLATHDCWRGAYNSSAGYWVINHRNPSKPELITTAGNEYYEGEIWAMHKDRGIGDCWNRAVWVWNGQTFAKTEEASTGMCRGFAGGAWELPTYVSDIIGNAISEEETYQVFPPNDE